MGEEFLLGAGFSMTQAKTLFLMSFIGGLTSWAGWAIYSFFRTHREDKSKAYGVIELVSSIMQVIALITIVIGTMFI